MLITIAAERMRDSIIDHADLDAWRPETIVVSRTPADDDPR